jgi:hypothetical protein
MEFFKEKIAIAEPEPSAGSVKYSQDYLSPGQESAVVFEDYLYYAALQSRAEAGLAPPFAELSPKKRPWIDRLSDYKGPNVNVDVHFVNDGIVPTSEDDAERMNTLRALRVMCFTL